MWAHVWRRKQRYQMVPQFDNGHEVVEDDYPVGIGAHGLEDGHRRGFEDHMEPRRCPRARSTPPTGRRWTATAPGPAHPAASTTSASPTTTRRGAGARAPPRSTWTTTGEPPRPRQAAAGARSAAAAG